MRYKYTADTTAIEISEHDEEGHYYVTEQNNPIGYIYISEIDNDLGTPIWNGSTPYLNLIAPYLNLIAPQIGAYIEEVDL